MSAIPGAQWISEVRGWNIYVNIASGNHFAVSVDGTHFSPGHDPPAWTAGDAQLWIMQQPDLPGSFPGPSTPDLITIGALDDRRVEWEAAYQNKQMTYAQYMAIFNAYNALYHDLSNRAKYDAYLAALGAPRTPVGTTPTEERTKSGAGIYYLLPVNTLHRLWVLREKWIGKKHKYLHPLV